MAHQVTASVLYDLMIDAFKNENHGESFENWRCKKEKEFPMFQYWSNCLDMELIMFMFIRAHRTGNFDLYVNSIKLFVPWFLAMDQHNYARWIPIYIRDLSHLSSRHPEIYEAFQNGLFVVQKSNKPFSSIGTDEAHEQNNGILKGDAGVTDLLMKPDAMNRWMLSGPEVSKCLREFQNSSSISDNIILPHHEESESFQKQFLTKRNSLKKTIEELGNPYLEGGKELYSLETNIVMSEECVKNCMNIKSIGEQKYKLYLKERIETNEKPVFLKLSKNNLKMFKAPKICTKSSMLVKSLKNDVDLFSRLFIISENRELDMDEFFSYENQSFPPSISLNGVMRSGDKSSLLKCLLKPKKCLKFIDDMAILEKTSDEVLIASNEETSSDAQVYFEAIVYDGPAMVHMLEPRGGCKTFDEYSKFVFQKHLKSNAEFYRLQRMDIVWDCYDSKNIKFQTRLNRGINS